jgi:uncharacterized protein YgbK (DUF1537 family)
MTKTPQIGLIADDFTGAMDSGAQFSYSHLGVHFRFAGSPSGDVEIINTASREIPAPEAVERVQAACHMLAGRHLFKKIDSTLRGHIGAEIEAILAASPYQKAVICPAAPLQGRAVRDGVLSINGIPLEQTAFKDDPLYPAKTSSIANLVGKPAAHLPLDLVREPLANLTDAITASSLPLLTADAESPDDLFTLARAILAAQALPCGAFGLARAYLQALEVETVDPSPFQPEGAVLVLVGSANQVAREQIARLETMPDSLVLRFGPLATPETIQQIFDLLSKNKRILALCAAQDKTVHTPEWLHFGQTVSETGLAVLAKFQPQTILVVGGETVTHFCQQAGVESIQVLGEAAPGIPYGRLRGGMLDQRLLITKAGGFGTPETLNHIFYPTEKK